MLIALFLLFSGDTALAARAHSQQDHEANGTQLLLDVTLLEQMRRLALGSEPRLVDRGRVLVRPERLLHVLAAAAAAVAAAAATSLTQRRVCCV